MRPAVVSLRLLIQWCFLNESRGLRGKKLVIGSDSNSRATVLRYKLRLIIRSFYRRDLARCAIGSAEGLLHAGRKRKSGHAGFVGLPARQGQRPTEPPPVLFWSRASTKEGAAALVTLYRG